LSANRQKVKGLKNEDDIGVDLIGSQDHLEGVGLWSTKNIVAYFKNNLYIKNGI